MRYTSRVRAECIPRYSRVHVENSSRRASPVERRIHEKRLLAKLIETRKRRLELEEIYRLYIKYIKTMEKELRVQDREMQKARNKLMQMLANEESVENNKFYHLLLKEAGVEINKNIYHELDDDELDNPSEFVLPENNVNVSTYSYSHEVKCTQV